MGEAAFDPYLRWLGIRDPQRPPSHYRLLGLEPFESDPEVIATAADRQMAHVRTFQTGQFGAVSQRLLNELAAARVCLLNRAKKAAYDEQLRRRAGGEKAEIGMQNADSGQAGQRAGAAATAVVAAASAMRPMASFTQRRPASRASLWIGLAAGGAAALCCAVVWLVMGGKGAANDAPGDPVVVHQQPAETKPLLRTLGEGVPAVKPPVEAKPASPTVAKIDDHRTNAAKPEIRPADSDKSVLASKIAAADSPPRVAPLPAAVADQNSGKKPAPADRPAVAVINPLDVDFGANSKPVDTAPLPAVAPAGPPELRIAAKPEAKPEIKPAAEAPAKPARLPVPTKEAQATSEKTIQGIFKTDFEEAAHGGPDAKSALAKKLMQQALDTADDPAGRYVLLAKAEELAVGGGDLTAAVAAIDKLAELYEVQPLAEKFNALTAGLKNIRSADHAQAALDIAMSAIDESIAADNYDLAGKFAKVASGLAARVHNPQATATIRARTLEIDQLKKEFAKVADAEAKLAESPDDPAANFDVGYFVGVVKGDFEKALPLLAKGSDAAFKALAVKELANPSDAAEQSKLADGWWNLGEPRKEPAKTHLRVHAAEWYSRAASGLKGLAKAQAEARCKQANSAETMRTTSAGHLDPAVRALTSRIWHIEWKQPPGWDIRFLPDHSLSFRNWTGAWTVDAGVVECRWKEQPTWVEKIRLVGDHMEVEQYDGGGLANTGIGRPISQ